MVGSSRHVAKNEWYFYLPLILLVVAPITFAMSEKVGAVAMFLAAGFFFVMYFVVLFKKNLSKWFILGFFFALANLVCYVIMLILDRKPKTR